MVDPWIMIGQHDARHVKFLRFFYFLFFYNKVFNISILYKIEKQNKTKNKNIYPIL